MMAKARAEALTYRDSTFGNTVLHEAIVSNNTSIALQYIQEDQKASDGQTFINVQATGNSPLQLAIKKGNMAVAIALAKHPLVDVSLTDCRGLTALHWACMLRQDALIDLLLAKGADPHHITKKWANPDFGDDFLHEMTPITLYARNVILFNFVRFYQLDVEADINRKRADFFKSHYSFYYSTFFGKNPARWKTESNSFVTVWYQEDCYLNGFADRKDLCIPGEMAYTDIIFHLKDLCTNLNWKNSKTELSSQGYRNSTSQFRDEFIRGIFDFCEYRNKMPVNSELLAKMQEIKIIPKTIIKDSSTPVETKKKFEEKLDPEEKLLRTLQRGEIERFQKLKTIFNSQISPILQYHQEIQKIQTLFANVDESKINGEVELLIGAMITAKNNFPPLASSLQLVLSQFFQYLRDKGMNLDAIPEGHFVDLYKNHYKEHSPRP